jgi:GPH family glycoside/pentoside/hexuronide:cation symporter
MSLQSPSLSESAGLVSAGEKLAYGLGDTASNFFFHTFNLFLLYYYTDVIGLSASAVGTMFLFTRLFDAVNDPVMGLIADRTKSRWGKFRPYLLWGALPYGLIGYAMFANPALGLHGKLIYAYVTYTLMMVAYTVVNIPYSALLGVMSPSSSERTSLSSWRFVCAFGGQLLIGAMVLPLVKVFGRGDEAAGFTTTIAIFAAISVAMFLFTFARTRERVAVADDSTAAIGSDLRFLLRNRPWIVLFFGAVFTMLNVAIRNGAVMFYFKYLVGSDAGAPVFWTLGSLALIAGVMSTKLLMRYFEKRHLLIFLTLANALALASFYVIEPTSLITLHVMNIVTALLAGPTPAIVWSMYADCADYGEWKFGRRTTGLIFSASLFALKVGLTLGGALSGWLLAYYGFVANTAQSAHALHGILVMFSLIPAGFAALVGVAMFFYPINDALTQRMELDLAARRPIAA